MAQLTAEERTARLAKLHPAEVRWYDLHQFAWENCKTYGGSAAMWWLNLYDSLANYRGEAFRILMDNYDQGVENLIQDRIQRMRDGRL